MLAGFGAMKKCQISLFVVANVVLVYMLSSVHFVCNVQGFVDP